MIKKEKIHIVGTHGVPAKYGGFETLADYFCQNLSEDFDIFEDRWIEMRDSSIEIVDISHFQFHLIANS